MPLLSVLVATVAVTVLLAAAAAVLMALAISSSESVERSIATANPSIMTEPVAGVFAKPSSVATSVDAEVNSSPFAPSVVACLMVVPARTTPRLRRTPSGLSTRLTPAAPVSSAVTSSLYSSSEIFRSDAETPDASVPMLTLLNASRTSSRVISLLIATRRLPTRNSPAIPRAVVDEENRPLPSFSRTASRFTSTSYEAGVASGVEVAVRTGGLGPSTDVPMLSNASPVDRLSVA